MLPILLLGGAAVAALFLEGCDSDHPNPPSPPPSDTSPDAGTSSDSSSAESSGAGAASPTPSASPTDTPDAGAPDVSPTAGLPKCEVTTGEEWKSSFFPGVYLDQNKFQEMLKGGPFCVQSSIDLASGTCADSHKTFPLVLDPSILDRRMIRFNLESAVGTTPTRCPSIFSIKAIDCHPSLGVNDVLACDEKPLLNNPLLIGASVSLTQLLKGDGNGDGQKDLLLQLSNGTGVYLSQIPVLPPEGGVPGENQDQGF